MDVRERALFHSFLNRDFIASCGVNLHQAAKRRPPAMTQIPRIVSASLWVPLAIFLVPIILALAESGARVNPFSRTSSVDGRVCRTGPSGEIRLDLLRPTVRCSGPQGRHEAETQLPTGTLCLRGLSRHSRKSGKPRTALWPPRSNERMRSRSGCNRCKPKLGLVSLRREGTPLGLSR